MLEEVANSTFKECADRTSDSSDLEINITRVEPVVLDAESLFMLNLDLANRSFSWRLRYFR